MHMHTHVRMVFRGYQLLWPFKSCCACITLLEPHDETHWVVGIASYSISQEVAPITKERLGHAVSRLGGKRCVCLCHLTKHLPCTLGLQMGIIMICSSPAMLCSQFPTHPVRKEIKITCKQVRMHSMQEMKKKGGEGGIKIKIASCGQAHRMY